MENHYFERFRDERLDVFQNDEYGSSDDYLQREIEFAREEDWQIEDTMEDWRFMDPDYVPSWEREEIHA